MKNPPPIEIDEAEVERLIDRGATRDARYRRSETESCPLLRTLVWLQRTLFETRISLSKLKKILFGKRTEKSTRKPQDPPSGSADGGQESGETPPSDGSLANPPASSTDTPADTPPDAPSDTRAERGDRQPTADRMQPRHAVTAASGRRIIQVPRQIFCAHGEFHAGDRCPECERGRLYPSRPSGTPALRRATAGESHPLRIGAAALRDVRRLIRGPAAT